jgi:hypothetical protein
MEKAVTAITKAIDSAVRPARGQLYFYSMDHRARIEGIASDGDNNPSRLAS